MRKSIVAAVLVLSANAVGAQSSADLVRLSGRDMPAEHGKPQDMSFVETRRGADASLVEVTMPPGPLTVSSAMFILKGLCSVAESRGKQYFRAVQLAHKPLRLGVTFPEEPGPQDTRVTSVTDRTFSQAECSLLNF
ncbi:hypothetical protein GCM10027321_07810 [Massilia terrae]|uniref:Uncharacterized protein n=1 Tax=Massilia terrae TaxID=1811224 RepID=A0ABT2D1I5_9BURK|nr:hypothetical protein [Massilia terrae]MCS0659646.1 hypothetical protein [Massilia terrae]